MNQLENLDENSLKVIEKLLEIKNKRLDFALDHHVNTRGDRMSFNKFPHIKELYATTSPYIVLQGSTQSLKSEWAIVDHFAMAYSGLSVFYVLPKFETRTTYVQNRINRCVSNVPEYKKIVSSGFFDNVALKTFGKGVIKYVGSNVFSDFREFPGDVLYVDEVDECHQGHIELGKDRLKASPYQLKRYIGNPRVEKHGINKYFLETNQKEYYVPCRSCNRFQKLDWFESIVQPVKTSDGSVSQYHLRDTEWYAGCNRDIHPICKDCGGILERIPKEGKWIPDQPDNKLEGYHISTLCSPINSISGLWQRFQKGLTDNGVLEQFYNSDLGLPFASVTNAVTNDLLLGCVDHQSKFALESDRAYRDSIDEKLPSVCGIDVGGKLDIKISNYINGLRHTVFIGKIQPNIAELLVLFEKYNVEKVVIDSGPELLLVEDLKKTCSMRNIDVWSCRYSGEGTDKTIKYDTNERVINIDRTNALDRSFSSLKMKRNILPANYKDILQGEFVKEMCSSVRHSSTDSKGRPIFEWTKDKDHQRHADTYEYLASNLLSDSVISEVFVG